MQLARPERIAQFASQPLFTSRDLDETRWHLAALCKPHLLTIEGRQARLIAAVFARDPAAAAETSAREVAGVVKSLAQRPEEMQKTITIWKNNALRPLAIAWTRCRASIPGSPGPA